LSLLRKREIMTNSPFFTLLKCCLSTFFLFPLLFSLSFSTPHAEAQIGTESSIQLITPLEGTEVTAKKPLIKCSIKTPFDPQRLLVLLDGTDVSALLEVTSEGFQYKPLGVLASGSHTLSVTAYAPDGKELRQEFTFLTRHSKTFEEAYSGNEITTLYEKLLGNSDEAIFQPSWKTESNLSSESKAKEKEWEFTFKTNVRHFDQNLPVTAPLEKGFSLANYLFQGKYNGKRFSFLGETGDVQITETPNTVQGLARRGGHLVFQSKDLHLQLRTFVVKSEQLIGFKGGMGIESSSDDHIMGVSGDLGLVSDKLRFRAIYVRGGEEGDSLGISTTGGKKKGDVFGFLFTTDLLKQALMTEAEIDLSKFDGDTHDEFSSEEDKAYRFKIGGMSGHYTYEAQYEYMGPDYEVIGNPGLQKNREGFTLRGAAGYPSHIINLSLSRYNDNVNKDDLYPRTYTYQGTLDYAFNKFPSLPIGLSYQKSLLESRWEPPEVTSLKTDTDMVTGRINYMKGPLNLGFSGSYSIQNDRTDANNDTTNLTLAFTPVLTVEKPYLSISTNISFNRSTSRLTNVHADIYTNSLDLRGDLLGKRLTYGFGGTYFISKASDRSLNQDGLSSTFNVSYLLVRNLWGFLNPSVGIRGLYNRTNDRLLDLTINECAIFLVIQTTMPFSF
jgi:hypothetical protein